MPLFDWSKRIAALVLFSGCMTPHDLEPREESLVAVLDADSFGGLEKRAQELFRSPEASYHLLKVQKDVAPHYHARHTETVVVISGEGIMVIAEEEFQVGPGSLIRIPEGMVHSFRPKGLVVALSVFNPSFDGRDRNFLK